MAADCPDPAVKKPNNESHDESGTIHMGPMPLDGHLLETRIRVPNLRKPFCTYLPPLRPTDRSRPAAVAQGPEEGSPVLFCCVIIPLCLFVESLPEIRGR